MTATIRYTTNVIGPIFRFRMDVMIGSIVAGDGVDERQNLRIDGCGGC
jgi:hypothetical protein